MSSSDERLKALDGAQRFQGNSGGEKKSSSSQQPENTKAEAPIVIAQASVASGRYIPPALKRQLIGKSASVCNPDEVRQRDSWDQLKKRVNGPVNKANVSNIKDIIVSLFNANLVRGRGLLCRSLMRAQSQSTSFTPVYAALVAVINTKLPIVGELLLTRLVLQFRRAFKRDDKSQCIASVMFLAHLTNQRVAHEVLAFQIVSLLLETPTDDSVEVAVAFIREVGTFLGSIAPRVLNYVFDAFRSILHEAEIDKRTQYMIEMLFQYRRDGFKDNAVIPEGLDLVEEDEQIVHEVAMDDEDLDAQDELNVFKFDPEFEANERKYAEIRRGILGEDESESESESGTEGDSESGGSSSDESDDEPEAETAVVKQQIHDLTETELINLRRTIYLAIMSSISFEEATHKLLKIEIRPSEEKELCNMVIECCSQERTYKNLYGLIGERLCKLNRSWANGFMDAFGSCYENIHRYETNHLRNIAHFFAHLLASEALNWSVLKSVVLTEEATTSSSRIFLKIMLQDMAENLGLKTLNEKLNDPKIADAVVGMFPSSDAKSIRFAINYYTSIGMGAITEEMREWLKTAPSAKARSSDDSSSGSDSGSYSSSSGSSSGSSDGSSSYTSSSYSSSSYDSQSDSSSQSSRSSHSQSPRAKRKYDSREASREPKNRDPASDIESPRDLSKPAQQPEVASEKRISKNSRVRSPSYSPIARSPRSPSRSPRGSRRRSPSVDMRRRHSRSPSMRDPERAAERVRDLHLDERRRHRDDRYSRRSRSISQSPPRHHSSHSRDYDRYRPARSRERHSRHSTRSRSPRSSRRRY
ncbi:pre-mRNA-splicing factor cwc22 [Coemansia brasiliensis]|uniref:Pre-mRNA-splicing factor cwc22 n=1 Tax=Coemansia brasiliensis TaxID=2650707 RepID=A0A9W8IC87_9FUNG|nr:pre-mRNA-splicing factor cwc22 [Coemansia brasiliensis]